MKIPFRQGIVRHRVDSAGNPGFLQKSNSGVTIDLIASSAEPTQIAFADGGSDYLYTENVTVQEAWGDFTTGTDYWLFWDISKVDASRTFGFTTLEPIVSATAPASPLPGQHWFDSTNTVMKVFNVSGVFVDVIRVFAAKYNQGSILEPYAIGSQVNINQNAFPGAILYDDQDKAVRKFGPRRRTEFITTESPLAAFAGNQAINFPLETSFKEALAVESIPQFHLISYKGKNQIGVATNTDDNPVVGIAREAFSSSQVGSFVTRGYVSNTGFNFTVDAGTPLYCSSSGQVTTTVPVLPATIQQIGVVVDTQTIFLDIQPQILSDGQNLVRLNVDRSSGQLVATSPTSTIPITQGFLHTQATPSSTWVVVHNKATKNILTQIYDANFDKIIPDNIRVFNNNTVRVTFATPQDGFALLTVFKV